MLSRRIDKFGVSSHIFAIIMRVWRITAACACGLPVHTFTCHQHRTTRSLWDDRNVVHIRYCLVVRVDRFALAFRSLPSIPYIYINFICLNEDNKENEAHRRMTHRKHFSQSFWRGLRKQNAVSLSISPSFAYLLRCEAHFLMFGGWKRKPISMPWLRCVLCARRWWTVAGTAPRSRSASATSDSRVQQQMHGECRTQCAWATIIHSALLSLHSDAAVGRFACSLYTRNNAMGLLAVKILSIKFVKQ